MFERNEAKCVNPCTISAGGGIEVNKSSSVVGQQAAPSRRIRPGAGRGSLAILRRCRLRPANLAIIRAATARASTPLSPHRPFYLHQQYGDQQRRCTGDRHAPGGGSDAFRRQQRRRERRRCVGQWSSRHDKQPLANNTAGSNNAAALLLGNPVAREISFVTVTRGTVMTNPAIVMEAGSLNLRDAIVTHHGVGVKLIGGPPHTTTTSTRATARTSRLSAGQRPMAGTI